MITYEKHSYNCSQYAIERVNQLRNLNIKFTTGSEWQVSFIRLLRSDFTEIFKPVDGCMVVMSQKTGGLHLGVYENYGVTHNYKPNSGAGSVIISDIGTINAEYKRVRFYDHNKAI